VTPSEIEAVQSVATIPNRRLRSAIALKSPAGSGATALARVWIGKDGWSSLAQVIGCHRREFPVWHLFRSGRPPPARWSMP
jgi:putative transposase